MWSYCIRLEENVGKSRGLYLINLCFAKCKITFSLFYRVLLVLLQDCRQKEIKHGDRTLGEETCATNKTTITSIS